MQENDNIKTGEKDGGAHYSVLTIDTCIFRNEDFQIDKPPLSSVAGSKLVINGCYEPK